MSASPTMFLGRCWILFSAIILEDEFIYLSSPDAIGRGVRGSLLYPARGGGEQPRPRLSPPGFPGRSRDEPLWRSLHVSSPRFPLLSRPSRPSRPSCPSLEVMSMRLFNSEGGKRGMWRPRGGLTRLGLVLGHGTGEGQTSESRVMRLAVMLVYHRHSGGRPALGVLFIEDRYPGRVGQGYHDLGLNHIHVQWQSRLNDD